MPKIVLSDYRDRVLYRYSSRNKRGFNSVLTWRIIQLWFLTIGWRKMPNKNVYVSIICVFSKELSNVGQLKQ